MSAPKASGCCKYGEAKVLSTTNFAPPSCAICAIAAMSAMRMNADLTYRPGVVGGSLVIAVVAATIALSFAFTVHRTAATLLAAVVMGIGICGLHYTAMFAAIITPRPDITK